MTDALQPAGRSAYRRRLDREQVRAPATVLSGNVRKLRPDNRREIELAIAEERRRLARELHDSVAQDLAFIVSQSLRLAGGVTDQSALERIAAAAGRALSDARTAIYQLSCPLPSTLGVALRDEANRIAERAGMQIELEVADEIDTTPEIEHAVLLIVQEAVSNAARHAGAGTVWVRLSSTDDRLVVTVADDGCGFDPTQTETSTAGGFGLVSMSERARSVGGEFRLESRLGAGTVVEIAVPA